MSTTQERVDAAVQDGVDPLRVILERQRQAFTAEGPPSVAVRRNRIDRLLALVLDNADEFVDAMEADFGTRPKTGSLFTEVLGMISVIEHTRSHVPQMDACDQADARRAACRPEGRGPALAAGRRRNHRSLELSDLSRRVACSGGVCGRQSGDNQDVRDHAQDRGADEVDGAEVLRPDRTRHRHGRAGSLRGLPVCRSTTCPSRVHLRSVHSCNRPPRRTWFR